MQRAFSSEFPNDNDELHVGTIWMSDEPCGRAEPHFALEEDDDPGEPIEIVDSIAIDEPDEIVPAPEDSPRTVSGVVPSSHAAMAIGAALEIPPCAPLPSFALEAFGDGDALAEALSDTAEDAPSARDTEPPAPDDPYASFVRTLADVASALGGPLDPATLEASLADDEIAQAWRAILRSESEDFALCATPLDEWAAGKLAALVQAPGKVVQLRRELRARGVAAFGLIEAA